MSKPLVRIIPQLNESPLSIILRTSFHNGFIQPSALFSCYKIPFRFVINDSILFITEENRWKLIQSLLHFDDKDCNNLYKLCSKNTPVNVKPLKVEIHGIILPRTSFDFKYPKICCECINDHNFAPMLWDHQLITACHKHKKLLLNHCPSCKKPLSWNRTSLDTCSCGKLLSNKNKNSKPLETEATEFIYKCFMKRDQQTIQTLNELYEFYIEFFKFLNISYSPHEIVTVSVDTYLGKPSTITFLKKIVKEKAYEGFHPRITLHLFLTSNDIKINEIARKVLSVLKNHYEIDTSVSLPSKTIKLTTVLRVLNISYPLLKKLKNTGIFNTFLTKENELKGYRQLETINKLLIYFTKKKNEKLNFDGICINQYSDISLKGQLQVFIDTLHSDLNFKPMNIEQGILSIVPETLSGYLPKTSRLSISETSQLCDINYENIRFLLKAGFLKEIDNSYYLGTTIFLLKKDVHEFKKQYMFASQLAKKYNCNPTNISEKIFSLGIEAVSGPSIDGGLTYLFKRSDLNSLDINELKKLKEYPTKTGRKRNNITKTQNNYIPSTTVAKILDVPIQRIRSLINDGFLEEFFNNERGIYITEDSLNRIIALEKGKDYINLKDACIELNESMPRLLSYWINGFDILIHSNGLNRFIYRKDLKKIERYKKIYINSYEAAKLMNKHQGHIKNLTKMNKLKPNKIFYYGKSKLFLFLRKDVNDFIASYYRYD